MSHSKARIAKSLAKADGSYYTYLDVDVSAEDDNGNQITGIFCAHVTDSDLRERVLNLFNDNRQKLLESADRMMIMLYERIKGDRTNLGVRTLKIKIGDGFMFISDSYTSAKRSDIGRAHGQKIIKSILDGDIRSAFFRMMALSLVVDSDL